MTEYAPLLLPLLAAMLYAVAASAVRGATERGVGGLHTTLIANITAAVVFLVFVPWTSGKILPDAWTPSLLLAGLFLCGQFLTVFALKVGHASVSTPAMGSKVVMVALIAFALGAVIGLNIWVAAMLTTIGIVVLAWPSEHLPLKPALLGITLSVSAATCFAAFDVFTQRYSQMPGLSFGRIAPPAMVICAAVSVVLVMGMTRTWPRIPRGAHRFLWPGVLLMSVQSAVIVSAVGYFGDAPRVNVVYGSRGIWSVLLVWSMGHYFSTTESHHHLSRGVFVRRLIGATLIGSAVVLVVMA